jgi:PAS domain S-box-containing protein
MHPRVHAAMQTNMNAAESQAEARFRALISASSDLVYHMSPDWREVRELYGRNFIDPAQKPGVGWIDKYLHPEDRAQVLDAIATAIRTKSPFSLEHRVVRGDGTTAWTFSRAIPMLGADGEITEWIGMGTDITARRNAEEVFARQKRLYEAILTNTPDLAYVWNLEHRFIYVNEGLLKMWGRTWEDAIGKNCLELGYEPWHAEMHDREIEQVRATKLPVHGEVPFNGTFGRRIYDYVLVPVIGASGDVEAVAGTTRDVTERKQLESSLLEADRRKDEFLATLSHELRNPLAPIRNAVHLLKMHNPVDPPVRAAREIIDRQIGHMVRLVDDLLEVSRITLGQVTLREDRIALQEVLRDAVEAVRPAAEANQHRLVITIPEAEIPVRGDPTRLSQVFQNLLDNAVKYTPPQGEIRLDVHVLETEVAVCVSDTGIGIAPELQQRVFDLFTRARSEDGIKTSGLGIGLSLARQLVKLHGGRIEVASAGPGQGSRFTVYLPILVAPQPAAAPPAAAEAAAARSLRVLVVDDNRDAAESLAMILTLQGCETAVAFGGAEALEKLSSFPAEIVLMDIGMPGMDGYEAARRIRANPASRDVVLVALTGWGQAADKQKAADVGFDEHLTKPVDPALLTTVLNLRRAPIAPAGVRG